MISMLIAVGSLTLIGVALGTILGVAARFMLRVVTVPKAALFPVVLVLCTIGAYALNNTMQNVYILLAFGLLGYAMVKFGFPLAPFILGVILGDQIEINLIRAIMTDANPWLFLTRPISGALILLSVASLVFSIWQHYRHRSNVAAEGRRRDAEADHRVGARHLPVPVGGGGAVCRGRWPRCPGGGGHHGGRRALAQGV